MKKNKKAKTDNEVRKAVLVPREVVTTTQDIQRQIRELDGRLNSYLVGLKLGLKIPEDWQLDLQKCAFIPPAVKK